MFCEGINEFAMWLIQSYPPFYRVRGYDLTVALNVLSDYWSKVNEGTEKQKAFIACETGNTNINSTL